MVFASAGGSGIVWGCDSAGRNTSESTFGKTMAYQYDLAGNRTRVTWPDRGHVPAGAGPCPRDTAPDRGHVRIALQSEHVPAPRICRAAAAGLNPRPS
ncbi:MAG: RHS repeat domain-containing protein [Caulobacter sp.]|nr:RHS repeat domain-containing protein [Caulobacter sp.]